MSKVPKVGEQALEESIKTIIDLRDKIIKEYKSTHNEDQCKELIRKAMLSRLNKLKVEQPILYGWLARAVSLMQLTNTRLNEVDLILYILTFYQSIKIQEEIDDVEGMFKNFK